MTRSYLQRCYRTLLPVAVLYLCLHPFQLWCLEVSLVSVVLLCICFRPLCIEECCPLQPFHCLTQQNHTFERPYIMCKTKYRLDYIWCKDLLYYLGTQMSWSWYFTLTLITKQTASLNMDVCWCGRFYKIYPFTSNI